MTDKAEIIAQAAEAGKTIEHSRWGNRLWYLVGTTTALILLLGGAVLLDKPQAVVSTLAGLIVLLAVLTVITPSAEQMTKMLAQVAAIRAGTKAD